MPNGHAGCGSLPPQQEIHRDVVQKEFRGCCSFVVGYCTSQVLRSRLSEIGLLSFGLLDCRGASLAINWPEE